MSQARAILRYAKISPTKARQVLQLISGKRADEALYQLKITNKKASVIIYRLLMSALANAEHKGMELGKLYIVKAFADEGPKFKKYMPRAHGRATPMLKRTSHITLVLEQVEDGLNGSKDTSDRV
ncbi:MAG: 50S ribosomal protein L22 [Aquificaceae bacterium]|nr:50S ribosomal protein L22 [Aquificaceae bacterium]